MKCPDISENADLFLDGEMPTEEMEAVEEHVKACASCAALVARHERLRQRLRLVSSSDRLPTTVRRNFEQRRGELACSMRRSARVRRLRTGVLSGSAAAALLLSLAAVLPMMVSDTDQGEREGPVGEVAGISALSTPVVGAALAWHERRLPLDVLGPCTKSASDWLSERGADGLQVPHFEHDATFLGARMGYIGDVPAAYAMYDLSGEKLSVLIYEAASLPLMEGSVEDVRSSRVLVDNSRSQPVLVYEDAGSGYALTGDIEEERLRALTRRSSVLAETR